MLAVNGSGWYAIFPFCCSSIDSFLAVTVNDDIMCGSMWNFRTEYEKQTFLLGQFPLALSEKKSINSINFNKYIMTESNKTTFIPEPGWTIVSKLFARADKWLCIYLWPIAALLNKYSRARPHCSLIGTVHKFTGKYFPLNLTNFRTLGNFAR